MVEHLKMKPGSGRQLPAHDEKQLVQLLIDEYQTSVISDMRYSYPRNDNRLLIEYAICFYDSDKPTLFFRKAHKKNGKWGLSRDLRVVSAGDADVTNIINEYMGD